MGTRAPRNGSLRNRLRFVLLAADCEPLAVVLALLALARGLWLLYPDVTAVEIGFMPWPFTDASRAAWAWGLGYVLVGGGQLLSVLYPHAARGIRRTFFAAGLVWLASGMLFLATYALVPAGAVYCGLGLASLWVYLRSGLEDD